MRRNNNYKMLIILSIALLTVLIIIFKVAIKDEPITMTTTLTQEDDVLKKRIDHITENRKPTIEGLTTYKKEVEHLKERQTKNIKETYKVEHPMKNYIDGEWVLMYKGEIIEDKRLIIKDNTYKTNIPITKLENENIENNEDEMEYLLTKDTPIQYFGEWGYLDTELDENTKISMESEIAPDEFNFVSIIDGSKQVRNSFKMDNSANRILKVGEKYTFINIEDVPTGIIKTRIN